MDGILLLDSRMDSEGSDHCDLTFQRLWSWILCMCLFCVSVFPEPDMFFVSEEEFEVALWSRKVQEGSSVSSQD